MKYDTNWKNNKTGNEIERPTQITDEIKLRFPISANVESKSPIKVEKKSNFTAECSQEVKARLQNGRT
jgi:hypothetical protein